MFGFLKTLRLMLCRLLCEDEPSTQSPVNDETTHGPADDDCPLPEPQVRKTLHPIKRLHELPDELLTAVLSPAPLDPSSLGDSVREETLAAINWQALADDANPHVIGVLVYERLLGLGLAEHIPKPVAELWEAGALHARLQHILHRRDALEISETFAQYGIRHAFIKGFAYRDWLYEPAWVRLGGDVDIIIDRQNVEAARQLMCHLEFTQAAYSADVKNFRPATAEEIARVEAEHYELGLFTKDHYLINHPEWLLAPPFVPRSPFAFGTTQGGHVLHSSFDIHWAIHFTFAHATPLDSLRLIEIAEGETIPVLGPEWNILISAFKLYFEAFDRPHYGFNHLVDLIALMKLGDEINWPLVQSLVRQYHLEAAMFYTLSAAQRIAGVSLVPAPLLEEWSRIKTNSNNHHGAHTLDYGDFVPYLINQRVASNFPKNHQ